MFFFTLDTCVGLRAKEKEKVPETTLIKHMEHNFCVLTQVLKIVTLFVILTIFFNVCALL